MRIDDALDLFADSDADGDRYDHRVKSQGYRRARTERREAARKARESARVGS